MTCPNLQGRLQCRDIYVNFPLLWVPEFRVQSSEFFLLLCGVVGLAAGEREILWHPG